MNFRNRMRLQKSRRLSKNIMSDLDKWRQFSRKFSGIELIDLDTSSSDESIDWEKEFFGHTDESDNSEEDDEIILTKKQTLILATMVPNELLLMDK